MRTEALQNCKIFQAEKPVKTKSLHNEYYIHI